MSEPKTHVCYVCCRQYVCGLCNNPKIRYRHCTPPKNVHICGAGCLNEYINLYTIHKL